MHSITALDCSRKFYESWVARFGLPDYLVTDQGPQFESALLADLLKRMGTVRHRTTPYHPQANGLIERAHSTLKNMLRCLMERFHCWESALPSALLAMRCAVNDLGVSASLIVYGEQIAVPSLMVEDPPRYHDTNTTDFVQKLQQDLIQIREYMLANDPTLIPREDEDPMHFPHKSVWIKDPILRGALAPKYHGPYPVVYYEFPVVTVRKDGVPYKVNVDRVKPAYQLMELEDQATALDNIVITPADVLAKAELAYNEPIPIHTQGYRPLRPLHPTEEAFPVEDDEEYDEGEQYPAYDPIPQRQLRNRMVPPAIPRRRRRRPSRRTQVPPPEQSRVESEVPEHSEPYLLSVPDSTPPSLLLPPVYLPALGTSLPLPF